MLHETHLKPPSEQDWLAIAQNFDSYWNFPHCIGAMDGKHIVIQAPPNSGTLFFNYKGTFSVVLLALVNADYTFIAVDIGNYGRNSDGGTFARSPIGKGLADNALNVPKAEPLRNAPEYGPMPYSIVADEAFPLKEYLLRPYPGRHLPQDKRIFNYRLFRARRISENAFALLATRWRIYQRRLGLHPENLNKVIKATVILHNMLQRCSRDELPVPPRESDSESASFQNIEPQPPRRPSNYAMEVRDKFKEYFSSQSGSVPWQNGIVNRGIEPR